ncbi:MAG: hypothetical protein M1840_008636 [Geoglossum simile]|nr:MAG: hypothetical protein M1840_008636 [Geoglossum simile]
MFRSITRQGRIPLQVAVYESDMITVKHLMTLSSDAEDSDSLFTKRMANIGLQAAVLYEKPAMVAYFISAGAHPLQPQFCLQPGKEHQLPPSIFADPKTSPNGVNTLHLCARAGSSAMVIGKHLINNLKPNYAQNFSNEERKRREQCAIELTDYLELPGGTDDSLLDKRDESDNTPFFTALENEEYELAYFLRSAGADKNALIRGTPIVEHLLTWPPTTARIALAFLVRITWGNLWMGRHPRRHYLDLVIAASKNWPPALATEFFNDVYGCVAPRHDHESGVYNGYTVARKDGGPMECGCHLDWDAHISKAVEGLQPYAVSELVRRRPHETPKDSYSPINALRRTLLGLKLPRNLDERRERFRAWKHATEMLPIIHHRYPDHRFNASTLLRGIASAIIQHIGPELDISAARFRAGALSARGLALQVTRLLTPFLAIAAGCEFGEVSKLQDFVQALVPPAAKVEVVMGKREQEKEGLEVEMRCDEEDGRVEWRKEGTLEGADLRCEVW